MVNSGGMTGRRITSARLFTPKYISASIPPYIFSILFTIYFATVSAITSASELFAFTVTDT